MILKRLAVWLLETLCEALLLMVFLTIIWRGAGQSSLADDLLLALWGTALVFMFGSGYVFTTAIFGVGWRSEKVWLYPAIAAALFITHVQFFATGWDSSTKVPVQAGGACIVFACTLGGNWFLRKWVQAGGSRKTGTGKSGIGHNS